MRRAGTAALVLLAAVLGGELGARALFHFPLYGADKEVGYWPLPSQRGTFLLSNDWVFNSHGLGVAEEFAPSPKQDVLLVGDSLVYGGNEWKQADKLGPTIERITNWQVWPAGAGSWALQNELAYLRRQPGLTAGADVIVFLLNSGDFGRPSEWKSPYAHPRKRPAFFLSYLASRYLLEPDPPASPLRVVPKDVATDWRMFVGATEKPVLAIAYADRNEAGSNCSWVPAEFKLAARWSCFDGTRESGAGTFFRDDIHPTIEGNRVLADFISARVAEALETSSQAP